MRNIFVTRQFEKDISRIPDNIRARAEEIISQLRLNPISQSFNIKKIKGIKSSVYRIRIGSYRLIYSFSQTSLFLLRFRHRKDIYRSL